jgi:hypothetical protein
MGHGTIRSASLESKNTIEFGFPYRGTQHVHLILRAHPRRGNDVILGVNKGQFDCASLEQCQVVARFDQGNAQRFRAVPAADHSTTTLFLSPFARFMEEVAKAKTVRIEAQFYQEGAPVIEFEVAGLVPKNVIGDAKPAIRRKNAATLDDYEIRPNETNDQYIERISK